MSDSTITAFPFAADGGKKVTATSMAAGSPRWAALLPSAAERQLGLAHHLARLIADPRTPVFVVHTVNDILPPSLPLLVAMRTPTTSISRDLRIASWVTGTIGVTSTPSCAITERFHSISLKWNRTHAHADVLAAFAPAHEVAMPSALTKRLRGGMKKVLLGAHEVGLRLGLVVLPKHYYVPFPDLHVLRRTRANWAKRSEMRGIAVDLDEQLRLLERLVRPFESEYRHNPAFRAATAGAFGPGFGYIEAQALHGFLRGTRPRRIIEIGSGVSTYCMMEAGKLNAAEGNPVDITCIEPYPSEWLRDAPVRLIKSKVEEVGLGIFEELEAGDLLFIDSTHTVRVGGDVMRVVTEILPRLAPGVYVHFHDIYLPYDFQRDADRSLFQWMETVLLHAYMINNAKISIAFCLSHLHYDRPDALRGIFPEYVPEAGVDGLRLTTPDEAHFPSSLYLRVNDTRPAAARSAAANAALQPEMA